ncbi:hypothetical protein BDW02DRAFT_497725 [Decorospora gaudefroyi]|uniref:Histone chaperone domain-containing protein n=1 Tax=Decorospora gaudefroyi TaxID=184978 RepID=A0A6A5KFG5_9PLEO|nr:hypothetical protein BDW02DRAFT_497725 [Decorospora gaudefroyi]
MSVYTHEPSAHQHNVASTTAPDNSTAASDSDSELSESSEEPSSDESSSEEDSDDGNNSNDTDREEPAGQNGVVNLRANRGKKPVMKLGDDEVGPDIRGFLKDFLPRLQASNAELEKQKAAGTLKSLDAGGGEGEGGDAPYIEMDLGLGVLEEKNANSHSDADSGSGSETEDGDTEKDVLGKLMGREKKDPAGIEVVQHTTAS